MKGVNINVSQGSAEIDLSHSFYTDEAVKRAMDKFKDLCVFEILKSGDKLNIMVKVRGKKTEVEQVVYELINHFLAEMKNERVGIW